MQLNSGSKTICLFSASKEELEDPYIDAARRFGALLGERSWNLVFGGGAQGLMGHVARALHEHGGHVTGVIPEKLDRPGVTYTAADELIVTQTLRERKHEMDRRADAFVALPGGFGTLEELVEVIALKQLGYHERPIVLLNTLKFYERLRGFFAYQVEAGFVREHYLDLFHVAATPDDAVRYIETYNPAEVADKYARG